jgi:acetolactate synthase small subunit
MKNTLCCIVQNRLGALDRVLGMLTARGYMPEKFVSSMAGNNRMQVLMTFECENEKNLEKLIKALYKQVTVIEIQLIMAKEEEQQNVVNIERRLAVGVR